MEWRLVSGSERDVVGQLEVFIKWLDDQTIICAIKCLSPRFCSYELWL